MRLLLAVGTSAPVAEAVAVVLREAGPVHTVTLPAAPSRAELEAALDARGDDNGDDSDDNSGGGNGGLVVLATDGGLNTVVQRLHRRGELDRPLAFVPVGPSTVAGQLGLPAQSGRRLSHRDSRRTDTATTNRTDRTDGALRTGHDQLDLRTLAAAARVALSGRPVLRGLIRDDHGGVLLGEATLSPWEGRTLGVRAYVEDTPVADGLVRELSVRPSAMPATPASPAAPVSPTTVPTDLPARSSDPSGPAAGGLIVAVSSGPLRRRVRTRGRAVTTSCAPARLTVDGVAHPRPQIRRTWWYEPDLWRVIVP